MDFRGEKRSNNTHRSTTDNDCRFASKGSTGTGAVPGYTVNALMENRNPILVGIGVEIFRSSASETETATSIAAPSREMGQSRSRTGRWPGWNRS